MSKLHKKTRHQLAALAARLTKLQSFIARHDIRIVRKTFEAPNAESYAVRGEDGLALVSKSSGDAGELTAAIRELEEILAS